MSVLDDFPYLAVGNEELGAPVGETAPCPHCGKEYPVIDSEPKGALQGVRCETGGLYLVGIDGKAWKPR